MWARYVPFIPMGCVAGCVVQAGFLLINISNVDKKAIPHSFLSSCLILFFSFVIFYGYGWYISFGESDNSLFFGSSASQDGKNSFTEFSVIFFFWSLLGISIMSSYHSVVDRISFKKYLCIFFVYCTIIYPYIASWGWGYGWSSPFRSSYRNNLLESCGALDINGCGIIFLSSGTVALVLVANSKPRHNRFTKNGIMHPSRNFIIQVIGTIMIVFGWFGITFALNFSQSDSLELSSKALLTTIVSCITAWLTGLLGSVILYFYQLHLRRIDQETQDQLEESNIDVRNADDVIIHERNQNENFQFKRYKKYILVPNRISVYLHAFELANNCILASIAASSSSFLVDPYFGFIIGPMSAILYILTSLLLVEMKFDDTCDTAAKQFLPSIWGLICAAAFTARPKYEAVLGRYYFNNAFSRSQLCKGFMFNGLGYQLYANVSYIAAIIVWSGGITAIVLYVAAACKRYIKSQFRFPAKRRNSIAPEESDGDDADKGKNKAIPMHAADSFQHKNGYSWDIVVVFERERVMEMGGGSEGGETGHMRLNQTTKQLLASMGRAGLEMELVYSHSKKYVFCKLRATVKRLEHYADDIDFKMKLDPLELEKAANGGIRYTPEEIQQSEKEYQQIQKWKLANEFVNETELEKKKLPKFKVNPIHIRYEPMMSKLPPYEHIYSAFEHDADIKKLFANHPGLDHPFGPIHRIKLIISMLDNITIKKPKEKTKNITDTLTKLTNSLHISNKLNPGNNNEEEAKKKSEDVERQALEEEEKVQGLDRMKHEGVIHDYFALHNTIQIHEIWKKWKNPFLNPWQLPVDLVKEYLGEKIGLYFNFLCHYTNWIMILAAAGLMTSTLLAASYFRTWDITETFHSTFGIPIFCVFVSVWSSLMLKYWKREENFLALKWGMTNYENEESVRPEFQGVMITSYVDGSIIKFFEPHRARKVKQISTSIIIFLISLVICIVSAIYYAKYYFIFVSKSQFLNSNGGLIASVFNSIQIIALNVLYTKVAEKLNQYENYRTDTEYEDALIIKLFSFQFINSFSSLFYVAFVKKFVGDPCYNSCAVELSQSLLIICLSRIIVTVINTTLPVYLQNRFSRASVMVDEVKFGNKNPFADDGDGAKGDESPRAAGPVGSPKMNRNPAQTAGRSASTSSTSCLDNSIVACCVSCCVSCVSHSVATDGVSKINASTLEKEFCLQRYDGVLDTLRDYAELVVESGYNTLFVVVLPVLPLLAVLSNWIQLRLDLWKQLYLYRRPLPSGAEDIGAWYGIMQSISTVSVISNVGILMITIGLLDDYPTQTRMVLLIAFIGVIFIIRSVLENYLGGVPQQVDIQLRRQSFLVEKLIKRVADEVADTITTEHIVDDFIIKVEDEI